MLIAIAVDGDQGLEAQASQHFGRCSHYVLVAVEDKVVGEVKTVENPFFNRHGEPGEVPAFIRDQGANVMIAGGMGGRAIQFFNEFGIAVCTGAAGKVSDVLKAYLEGNLSGAAGCAH